MFLKELNKDEAIAFTNLMSEFVLADEKVGKGEEALMERLYNEIGFPEEELVAVSFEDAINTIQSSSDRIKNIVYFELIKIGLADGEYNLDEVDFLQVLGDSLEIQRSKRIAFSNYYYQYSDVNVEESEEAKKEVEEIINN